MSSQPIRPSNAARDVAFDELQKSCPLVRVVGGQEDRKWTIQGERSGSIVIQVKAVHLQAAVKQFRESYYRMQAAGMLRTER